MDDKASSDDVAVLQKKMETLQLSGDTAQANARSRRQLLNNNSQPAMTHDGPKCPGLGRVRTLESLTKRHNDRLD